MKAKTIDFIIVALENQRDEYAINNEPYSKAIAELKTLRCDGCGYSTLNGDGCGCPHLCGVKVENQHTMIEEVRI